MQTTTLGRSGFVVSRMGLGLAALGRPGYINLGHADDLHHDYDVAAMEQQTHTVLDEAWRLGVRYFDAARSYGDAERFLGSWLSSRHITPEAVTIGSKWGYTYTAGWKIDADKHEVKEHTLPVLRRQIGESRQYLGAYLDLYQIHSATLDSGVLENQDVLQELARLRDGGLKIGLTVTGPRQAETIRRALDVVIGGVRLFACVQATWNLLESSAGPALHEAHEAGLGVIIKEGLANGRLTKRNTDPAFAAKRRVLEETAARLHTPLDALALATVLAQPWADVVLSGAATVEHLRSNVAAMQVRWDDKAAAELRPVLESPDDYWKTRSRLHWN
jgi:aryl-alcohol dehydrogenase-like predicted oxidoreductase